MKYDCIGWNGIAVLVNYGHLTFSNFINLILIAMELIRDRIYPRYQSKVSLTHENKFNFNFAVLFCIYQVSSLLYAFSVYLSSLLIISQEFLYLTIRSMMTLQLVRFVNNYKIFNFYDNKT